MYDFTSCRLYENFMHIFNSFNDIEIYVHVYFPLAIISFPQFLLLEKNTVLQRWSNTNDCIQQILFQISIVWIQSRFFEKQNSKYFKFSKVRFSLRHPAASNGPCQLSDPVIYCIAGDAFAMDYWLGAAVSRALVILLLPSVTAVCRHAGTCAPAPAVPVRLCFQKH